MEHHYVYQNWFRGKKVLQSEEITLNYYAKPHVYPDKSKGKLANKFFKICTSTED